jgi:hypothetical protein
MSLDVDSLKKRAEEFATFSNHVLANCVLAIDGWVCRPRAPFQSNEHEDVKSYFGRHGTCAVVVMIGCDARCRFRLFRASSREVLLMSAHGTTLSSEMI